MSKVLYYDLIRILFLVNNLIHKQYTIILVNFIYLNLKVILLKDNLDNLFPNKNDFKNKS